MKSVAAFRLLLAALLLLAFGFLVRRDCRAVHEHLDWLVASEPRLQIDPASESNRPILLIPLSNSGPAAVSFSVSWTECRTRSDLSLIKADLKPGGRVRKLSALSSGATTNVEFELAAGSASETTLLFCCQIEWSEKESALYRFSRQIDQPMYTFTSLVGTEWKPPWRNKRFVTGEVFAANVPVADYFRLVYGFTRQDWVEEQQQVQKRVAEFQQGAARLPRNRARGLPPSRRALSPSEQSAEQARTVFGEFCRTYTNSPAL